MIPSDHPVAPASSVALHVAEYEALMTRNTYLMTLQYSLLPAAILIVSLCAPLWSRNYDHNRLLIWSVYAALLVIGIVWVDALWELYNNVLYLERELRPHVRRAVGMSDFWLYERYQARIRGEGVMLWEFAMPALAVLLWMLAICLTWPFDARWPFPYWQYLAAGLTVLLNVRVFLRSRGAVGLRQRFSQSLTDDRTL